MERVKFWCRDLVNGTRDMWPLNPDKESESSKNWANSHGNKGESLEFDNIFNSVTLESLETRDQGGRAYKVLIKENGVNYRCDFREGPLLDVIKHTGIHAGGTLVGQFCFIGGASTTLVRMGSEQHYEGLELAEQQAKKKIKMKDLIVGNSYSNLTGVHMIYLGKVSVPKTITYKPGSYVHSKPMFQSYARRENDHKYIIDFEIGKYCTKHFFVEVGCVISASYENKLVSSSSFIADHGPSNKSFNIEGAIQHAMALDTGTSYHYWDCKTVLLKSAQTYHMRINGEDVPKERQKLADAWIKRVEIDTDRY